MGDFTDMIDGLPHITPMAECKRYSDQNGIEITVVIPLDGTTCQYISAINVQTNQGPMRVQFAIKAQSIEEAALGWREAAQAALREFGKKMKENQRRVILPGATSAPLPFKTIQ